MRRVLSRATGAVGWRLRFLRHQTRALPAKTAAWLASYSRRGRYDVLDERALRSTRRSDTVFVFGSGASLNTISATEWTRIATHDTVGFNWFVRQRFVRCDYHFVREISGHDMDRARWRTDLAEYFDLVRGNPRYTETVFLVQGGFRALNGNRALGYGYLPEGRRVFLWRSLEDRTEPSPSLSLGLTHRQGTLSECVNFAAVLGWRSIVLAGVDLYDRRYFWLPPDQPREGDQSVHGQHNTAQWGLVEGLGRWHDLLAARGIGLYCYNPRSLLVPTLPLWTWPAAS